VRFPGSPAQVAELKKAFHQGGAKGFLRMMVSQKANEGADAIEVAAYILSSGKQIRRLLGWERRISGDPR